MLLGVLSVLKQFTPHLLLLEVKSLNQCSEGRGITSQNGNEDRTACPGGRSNFTSADQAPLSFLGCFTVLVKQIKPMEILDQSVTRGSGLKLIQGRFG